MSGFLTTHFKGSKIIYNSPVNIIKRLITYTHDFLSQESFLEQPNQTEIRLPETILGTPAATEPLPESPGHQRRHSLRVHPSSGLWTYNITKKLQ